MPYMDPMGLVVGLEHECSVIFPSYWKCQTSSQGWDPFLNAEIHVLDKHQEVQDGWNIHVMGMEFAT